MRHLLVDISKYVVNQPSVARGKNIISPSLTNYRILRNQARVFSLENYKILIVDDFSQMRSTCRRMLAEFDPDEVDDSSNGNDAIEKMRRKSYDIVLCDYNLGTDKDGQQILEEARHEAILDYASIFMMITGENTKAMVMAAVEYEPDDYLTKPFTKEVLLKRLQRLIYRKQGLHEVGKALADKDFNLALSLCDSLIDQYPKNTISLLKAKGSILYQVEDFTQAAKLYQGVLDEYSLPWANMGLGKVHFECEEYTQAKQIFSDLINESPNQVEAYDWLAKTLAALGETEQAQLILQKASELSPQVLIRRQLLADMAIKNGDMEVAEIASKAAVKLSKGSSFKRPEDFTNLAKILVDQKHDQRALRCLQQGRENFANQTDAMLRLSVSESQVHHKVNRETQAKKSLEKAMDRLKRRGEEDEISGPTSLEIAEACLSYGDTEAGMDIMLEVVENNHENKDLIDRAREAFDKAGLAEEGEMMMQKTIARIADINNQGAKLANEGKLEQAIELFVNAAKKLPSNIVINLNATQALVLDLQKNGCNLDRLEQCQKYLNNVKLLDATDKRYRRLLKQFQALEKQCEQS